MSHHPLNEMEAQLALRERVKELTCLYGISQLAAQPGISLGAMLQGVVDLLPPAWQYPEIAFARIVLDGHSFKTAGFRETGAKQKTDLVVNGRNRGWVKVGYAREMPDLDEGPFLKEERSLVNAVAKQVAFIIERREAKASRAALEEQLRHADRLATIGQLAAGVAHELNEPLGNILGFAQLLLKAPGQSEGTHKDVQKIEAAALHAREVIRKLLVFARQMPPEKTQTSLNDVVTEGLYFFEARCSKSGVVIHRALDPSLPEITADAGQMNQVLVNLVVNAIHAMPDGGVLSVETSRTRDQVRLGVADTGIGMSQELLAKVFLPFFTTKDVDQGTGLGLAVVHGIVSAHYGTVEIESTLGAGSRFEVRLPIDATSPTEEEVLP